MMGTVGVPITTIEARLESVPEMGYDALSSVPRGEICLRGNTLFSGYYKRPDITEEVVVDGWFHTGKRALPCLMLKLELFAKTREATMGTQKIHLNL